MNENQAAAPVTAAEFIHVHLHLLLNMRTHVCCTLDILNFKSAYRGREEEEEEDQRADVSSRHFVFLSQEFPLNSELVQLDRWTRQDVSSPWDLKNTRAGR